MLALVFAFWLWLFSLFGPPPPQTPRPLPPPVLITPTPIPSTYSPMPSASSAPKEPATTLDVTAYCATGNNTASGVPPEIGMAAGNRWPFGTVLDVPGYGHVVITDRIGHGSDLDLYMGAGQACLDKANSWGRRRLDVRIVS